MKKHSSFEKDLSKLDPFRTVVAVSSYMLQPSNSRALASIEFAILLAACHCRGTKHPSREEISQFMKKVGNFLKEYKKKVHIDPLSMAFMTQNLFYGQEADTNQLIEATWRKFERHDSVLEQKLGFNVANAIFFAKIISTLIIEKMMDTSPPKEIKLTKKEYYDFSHFVDPEENQVEAWGEAIQFSEDELLGHFPPQLHNRLLCYLKYLSIDLHELPKIFDPLETNILAEKPIIKFKNRYLTLNAQLN